MIQLDGHTGDQENRSQREDILFLFIDVPDFSRADRSLKV